MPETCRVWTLALADGAGEEAVRPLLEFLDGAELARLERLKVAADRALFVAGRALARALLSAIDGRPSADWRFAAGPHGRPEIAGDNPSALSFNISHTPGMAASAAICGAAVGVDVERLGRKAPFDDLAKHKFAAAEQALVLGADEADRARVFFSLWTLKEAYIKAIGRGLAEPLDGFAFTLDPVAVTFMGGDDPAAWGFRLLGPSPGHILALAAKTGGDLAVVHDHVSVAELAARLQGG